MNLSPMSSWLRRVRKAQAAAISTVTFALLSTPAWAGPVPPETPGVEPLEAFEDEAPAHVGQQQGIENIVVTARRREENVQDTPLSITALSGNALENQGAMRADEIQQLAPNLLFDQSAGRPSEARLSIRGVGNVDPIATRDNGVGVYLDGVYMGRSAGQLLELVDVERVEVLRGPQGTLFGRNTIGGAVSLHTRKPVDTYEAGFTVRAGSHELFESRGSVNIPVVPETSALRVAFQTATRGGYSKNTFSGKYSDDRKLLMGRASFRYTPSDTSEWIFRFDQSRAHTSARGGECRFRIPDGLTLAQASSVVNTYDNTLGVGFIPGCQANQANDELRYHSNLDGKSNVDTLGTNATFSWDLGETTFKSVSSWRRVRLEARDIFDGTGIIPFTVGAATDLNHARSYQPRDQQEQWSQEFQLTGSALGDNLEWTTGVFGLQEKLTPGGTTDLFVGYGLCLNGGALLPFCAASGESRTKAETLAYSAYGQLTYHASDFTRVTAGLRRSHEKKRLDFDGRVYTAPGTLGAWTAIDNTERYAAWTPMVTVDHNLTDDVLAYATFSRGFKSGGFNGRPSINPALASTRLPFEQEKLDNYEVGVKSSWWGRKILANLALFHGNYQDMQLTVLTVDTGTGAFASRVTNAGKSVIRGAELEVLVQPTPALDFRVGLGVNDSKYKEFTDASVVTGNPVDRSDEDLQFVPTYTGQFSVGYTFFDLFGLGDLTARANWNFWTGINYGPAGGSDSTLQGKYGLLSGRLSLTLPDGLTTISAYGSNLLDRRYINSGINFETGFVSSTALYGPPRMWGFEVRRSFE